MSDFNEMNLDDIEKSDESANRPLKLDDGDSVLRIMPPHRKGALYFKKYRMHFGIVDLREFGLRTDGWFAEPCLAERVVVDDDTEKTLTGQPCPLCEIANKAYQVGSRTKDESVLAIAKKVRAKTQYVSNVINMDDVGSGVQRYVFGKKINDAVKGIFRRKGNITNPHEGRAVCISKTIVGDWPEYAVSAEDASDLGDVWDTAKENLHNLDEYPIYSNYADLDKKVEGVSFDLEVQEIPGYNSGSETGLEGKEDASLDALLEG